MLEGPGVPPAHPELLGQGRASRTGPSGSRGVLVGVVIGRPVCLGMVEKGDSGDTRRPRAQCPPVGFPGEALGKPARA